MTEEGTHDDTPKVPPTAQEKPTSLRDLVQTSPEEAEDNELLALLTGEDGKLDVNLDMPGDYQTDIMAAQLVGHITGYHQQFQLSRAARSSGDNANAEKGWKQAQFHRIGAAIIQRTFPGTKDVADKIMAIQAEDAKVNREKAASKLRI